MTKLTETGKMQLNWLNMNPTNSKMYLNTMRKLSAHTDQLIKNDKLYRHFSNRLELAENYTVQERNVPKLSKKADSDRQNFPKIVEICEIKPTKN